MGAIQIDKVREGMVLSADVRDVSSRLLVSKGARIENQHIRVFKIWGVAELCVEESGSDGPTDSPLPESARTAQCPEWVRSLFSHQDMSHPAVRELFELSASSPGRRGDGQPNAPSDITLNGPSVPVVACDVRGLMDRGDIVLPEIPPVVAELNEAVTNPRVTAQDIAKIVNNSPSLTVLLLKIVNSALYSFPSKIDSISRAVTLIGFKEISALAISITTVRMFQGIPGAVVDMRAFLRHSLACGIIARILAAHKNIPRTELMFASGLLHDIGRLIVYRYFPDQALGMLRLAAHSRTSMGRLEKPVLGCRHTEIGGMLLTRWKLPLMLENNVRYHHRPSAAPDILKAAVIHVADILANALGLGTSGERMLQPLDTGGWEALAISPCVLKRVADLALHQLKPFETLLTMER